MKTISIHEVLAITNRMTAKGVPQAEFYFGALLSYNEFALSVATRLPVGHELRDEMLEFSKRAIPARFAAYVDEGWNDIQSDPVARQYLRTTEAANEADKQTQG